MNTPAPSFLIGSSSFLEVTRTAIRCVISLKFSEIRPWTAELRACELWKMAVKCCENFSAYIFDPLF